MSVSIPVMKFGGVTLQGINRFGPDEERLLDECHRQRNLTDMYRLLAQRRNLARAHRLEEVADDFIKPLCSVDCTPVVVVSAFDWATDKLEQLAASLSSDPDPREYARLLMSGELRANAALAIALVESGFKARSLTGREAGIVTDKRHEGALVERCEIGHVKNLLERQIVPVVAGFQGYYWDDAEQRDEVSILGRGGSNLTAVALADALDQPEFIMFTNVDGIYDKDPNKYADASKISEIGADELLTWDPFPQVIQKEAVEYAVQRGVDIWIRDGFDANKPGTLIRCRQ
jgi:aspartate kinase